MTFVANEGSKSNVCDEVSKDGSVCQPRREEEERKSSQKKKLGESLFGGV
jgi:hypothetical protein